jgi:hypothetical protein
MGIEWDVAVFENGIMTYLQHAISREHDDKLLDFGAVLFSDSPIWGFLKLWGIPKSP